MPHSSQKIALCGIFGALALVMLLAGDLVPIAVYLCPAAAGLLILPIAWQTDRRAGWLCYTGIAVIALLLLPDKEPAILFCAFFGYYPMVRFSLERLHPRLLRLAAKLALFNAGTVGAYWVLLRLFADPVLQADFAELTGWLAPAFLLLANFTFVVYDVLVGRLRGLYDAFMRPRLEKGRGH